jgi:hypothetical protein
MWPCLWSAGSKINGMRWKKGYLAKEFGGEHYELRVCANGPGMFYLGTMTPDGEPFTRESADYWPTEQEAQEALRSDPPIWTQRLTP